MKDIAIKIEDLRPKLHAAPIQCSVTVEEMQLQYNVAHSDYRKRVSRRTGKDLHRCMKQSKYSIDGRNYCTLHAGRVALLILLGDYKN